jgi:hypothetical protein
VIHTRIAGHWPIYLRVAIPVSACMFSDLWCLDMNTPENPDGELSMKQLHTTLADVRQWEFASHDPATQWTSWHRAQESAILLTDSTTTIVNSI